MVCAGQSHAADHTYQVMAHTEDVGSSTYEAFTAPEDAYGAIKDFKGIYIN